MRFLFVSAIFHVKGQELEADLDVYNLTNTNTVDAVRQGTGTTPVTNYTTGQTVRIATFNSTTGVLGPRSIRLNISYRFGGR